VNKDISSDPHNPNRKGDLAFTRESPYGTAIEPMYSGATSFMRRRYSRDLSGVDVAVVGVPFDLGTTNRAGARFGPRAVRAASTQLAWARPWPWTFDPFDRLHVIDYGDCVFDPGRPASVLPDIEVFFTTLIKAGVIPLSLGGDHLITYPILKAIHKQQGAISLVHFDAHSDTWEDERDRVDHGTMFFHAVKEGLVDPATSVQIGLRTHNEDTLGFNILDAGWVHEHGAAAVIRETRKILGGRLVYLSFDIDCLDPSFAPGTGTPVCGGLSSHQAMSILRGLAGIRLVGMDMVEVAPAYDVGEITALAASQIAMEMIALYACRPE